MINPVYPELDEFSALIHEAVGFPCDRGLHVYPAEFHEADVLLRSARQLELVGIEIDHGYVEGEDFQGYLVHLARSWLGKADVRPSVRHRPLIVRRNAARIGAIFLDPHARREVAGGFGNIAFALLPEFQQLGLSKEVLLYATEIAGGYEIRDPFVRFSCARPDVVAVCERVGGVPRACDSDQGALEYVFGAWEHATDGTGRAVVRRVLSTD